MAALASSGLSQHPEHAAFKAPSRHGSAMPLGKLGGWCRGRATAPWKLPLGALQSLVLAAITQDRGVVLKSANRRLQPSLMSRGKSSQTSRPQPLGTTPEQNAIPCKPTGSTIRTFHGRKQKLWSRGLSVSQLRSWTILNFKSSQPATVSEHRPPCLRGIPRADGGATSSHSDCVSPGLQGGLH